MFKFAVWLGSLGFFKYSGLVGLEPRWWPKARVRYPDGLMSRAMPVGNACVYASIFSGEVVPLDGGSANTPGDTFTIEEVE